MFFYGIIDSWQYFHNRTTAAHEASDVLLTQQITMLESTIGFLNEDLDEGYRLMSLSTEFNTTPIIVHIVDYYSRLLVTDDPEWVLIGTHENFTHMFLSLMWHESKVKANAIGDKGKARGLTQIWTSTAKEYDSEITAKQLLDPETNIKLSMEHFQYLLQVFEGNDKLALLAWNRGKSTVEGLIARGHNPENGFAERVRMAAIEASRHAITVSFGNGD